MTKRMRISFMLVFIFLLAFYAIIENNYWKSIAKGETEQIFVLPDKRIAPAIALGFGNLWADLLLIQAQFYFAETMHGGLLKDARKLHEMLDLITTLDPKYEEAYVFGHFALSTHFDLIGVVFSNEILEKAYYNLPNHRFPKYIGFNYLMHGENPREVIKWMKTALTYPEAPKNLIWIVDRVARGNSNVLQMQMGSFCGLCEETKEVEQRKHYCLRCKLYSILVMLNDRVQAFRQAHGERPESLAQLVQYGYLENVPPDPLGGTWVIMENGQIDSSKNIEKSSTVDED